MGKMKEHYYEQLEALAQSQGCQCSADINGLDDLCPPCQNEIPDEVINRMANELNDEMSEKEFWSKMNEIEEYFIDNYVDTHVASRNEMEDMDITLAEVA